jgi:hypothetical protein
MEIKGKLILKLTGYIAAITLFITLAGAQTPVTTTTTGVTNTLTKFDGASSITNSAITESGGNVIIGSFNLTSGGWVAAEGGQSAFNFFRRNLASAPTTWAAGDVFSWYNPDGTARLWTFQSGDVLTVLGNGAATFGPFAAMSGPGAVSSTGVSAGLGFMNRTKTSWPADPAAGDFYAWYNPDGTARLWTFGTGDVLKVQTSGELDLQGSGGLRFPDGSLQLTATLQGPKGDTGAQGPKGETGAQGPPGPAVHTSAVCGGGPGFSPSCPGGFVVFQQEGPGGCTVTSDTGSCSLPGGGGRTCAVCKVPLQ